MKKKIIIWSVWFMIAMLACIILFFATRLRRQEAIKLPAPRADMIVTSAASNGTVLIEDKTAGYAITVPRDWYIEKSVGSGMTVYPDYAVAEKAPPDCKIEISAISNPGRSGLPEWLTTYLHGDPMADFSEISRIETTTRDAPAIVWDGVLNGVSSTLAYIATGTTVYEIAPSAIAAAGDGAPINADCENAFQTVLNNFQLEK